jgi:hypothetical protein
VAAVGVAGERAHAPRSTEHAASDSGQSSASPLQAFGCSTPIMAFDMEKELADNDFNKVIQDVEEVIYHATAKPGSGLSVCAPLSLDCCAEHKGLYEYRLCGGSRTRCVLPFNVQ